jgi:hypothetical protein
LLKNSRFAIAGLILLAAAFLALDIHGAYAAFFLNDWKYVKAITLPAELSEEGLVEFSPDLEIFANAAADLADLRIITGGNTEVPYKLEIDRETSQRTAVPVTLRDQGYTGTGQTTFTAVLGHTGALHNEIEFQTTTANFRGKAEVEASYDGVLWEIVGEQTVFNFTVSERGFTAGNTGIPYPDSAARYLRVTIDEEDGLPLEITGAAVFFKEETPAYEIAWPVTVAIKKISRDTSEGTTTVDIDTRADGLPGHRLAIRTTGVNFHRPVTVQTSSDGETWKTILTGAEIYSYDTPKFTGSHLDVVYPETTARYIRLIILDEDSPPVIVKGIDIWSLRRRLVFLADPQSSYHLYYGNVQAPHPSYDIGRILPYLETGEIPEASLSIQATNVYYIEKSAEPDRPLTERFPWLLPVVIGIAVVVVAVILLRITRQAWQWLFPPQE